MMIDALFDSPILGLVWKEYFDEGCSVLGCIMDGTGMEVYS